MLFDANKAAKEGLIITKEPTLLGGDQYDIAAKFALDEPKEGGTVIVVRGDLEYDSITASSFANAIDADILLVEPNKIPYATLNALDKLKPDNIFIVGGLAAVSSEVEESLNVYCLACARISGENRYETSLNVAKKVQKLTNSDTVIITDGNAPVTYAASLAVKFNAPIVYLDESAPNAVNEFLEETNFVVETKLLREG